MSEWKAKRFWSESSVVPEGDGFGIRLDGRVVKTPAKSALALPKRALAQAIATEWDAQDKIIDPETMPLTRLANSAIDKVSVQQAEVAALVADYGASDLLCYRAEGPEVLVARQAERWDPMLNWAAQAHEIRLNVQSGIMPVKQPADSIAKMHSITASMDPFALTAFHELVSLSGSWVLGLAAMENARPIGTLWDIGNVDEIWQAEQWGADEEAAENQSKKSAAFHIAHVFCEHCRSS